MSLDDAIEDAEKLKSKAEDKPEQVKEELLNGLKPMIKLADSHGKNCKPEKRLYKKLKDSNSSEAVVNAISSWEDERQ